LVGSGGAAIATSAGGSFSTVIATVVFAVV